MPVGSSNVGEHECFETKPERTFRARNDRYNLVVTGNRWFDNKAGLGELVSLARERREELRRHSGQRTRANPFSRSPHSRNLPC